MITRNNLPSTQQLVACLQLSTVTAKRPRSVYILLCFLNYYVETVSALCNTNLFTCICNTHSILDEDQGKCGNVPPQFDVGIVAIHRKNVQQYIEHFTGIGPCYPPSTSELSL